MDYELIENEIADFLKDKVAGNGVTYQTLPDVEADINPKFGERKVTVAFAKEDASPSNSLGVNIQDLSVTFAVAIVGRRIKGADGLYKLADLIKKKLPGFTPTDCGILTYSSHELIKAESGIFQYALYFSTTGLLMQEEPPETGPPFKELVLV